jgi:dipeptidyl aminopeptidase/acylaminoacyl peptidase
MKIVAKFMLAIATFTLSLCAMAQTKAPLIPVEDFTKRPRLSSVSFSPDGKRFAALEEFKGRMNVVVIDLDQNKIHRTTALTDYDVRGYSWINSKRIVFSIIDLKSGLTDQRGFGVFAVDFDGTEGKTISSNFGVTNCAREFATCRGLSFVARAGKESDEIYALMFERDIESPDIYKLNTRTFQKTLITTDNPGNVIRYILDKDFVPRAAITANRKTGDSSFIYKDNASSKWRTVSEFKEFQATTTPIGFDLDGTLFLVSNVKSDKAAIYTFEPKTGGFGEKIAAHKDVDIDLIEDRTGNSLSGVRSPLIVSAETNAIIGLQVEGDKPETYWFDEKLAKLQKQIDATLGADKVNTISPVRSGLFAIRSFSDWDPGTFYLYDEAKAELRQLIRPIDWIKPEQMGQTRVVRYKARDGLEIPGYLTVPAGKEAKNLPLIAWIHGGPWARDDWGYNAEVQFFASRGYAVFQPNYRGSTGFGQKHTSSAFKQLGQSMQDDITDGIEYLAKSGLIDQNRVCIGGGSYGGYATMMGVVKTPDLYKCAINVVGVTNLFYWIELGYTDFNRIDASGATRFLKHTVGDPSTDKDMMTKYSPVFHTDRIKAPVLIVHGAEDIRVPLKHAEDLRAGLEKHGKPYEWLVFKDEGHGFLKQENRTAYFKRMEAFLAKHLPVN